MPAEAVLAAATAAFVASLLGSVHCAGMCGGLVACTAAPALPSDRASAAGGTTQLTSSIGGRTVRVGPSLWATQSTYHLARGLGYIALGGVAGALGAALDLGGSMVGVQRIASIAAGGFIAILGAVMLLRIAGARIPHAATPAWVLRLVRSVHGRAMRMPPVARAGAIGLATPLLPCGWLYAFVAVAAGAGSILGGMAVMTAFWLGTIPVLVAVAVGLRAASGPLRAAMPIVAALLMIGVGLHLAFVRGGRAMAVASAFHPVDAGAESASLVEEIEAVEDDIPACCREEPE
jgi:sulfite exporter TauE/SafE